MESQTISSTKREFIQWIKSLDWPTLSDPEKRFINLLITYFDELAGLGTAGGGRARRLGQLIQEKGLTSSTDRPEVGGNSLLASDKIQKIIELKIGPFRGFRTEEILTFDRPYIFMYGPNGSGKSSFCEGIEYALLGEIEEAEAKRIPLSIYIRNEDANDGLRPVLRVLKADGKEETITSGNPSYRFSFIEKNRIDAFARISATTAKDQSSRIATLFGLDRFSEFVDGFTDEFDQRYLNLENKKANEFKIASEGNETKKRRRQEIKEILSKAPDGMSAIIQTLELPENSILDSIQTYLSGENGVGGKIAQFQEQKVATIGKDLDITVFDRLGEANTAISNGYTALNAKIVELGKFAASLNFKDLYQSILSISTNDGADLSRCPACQTPLQSVMRNPFDLATKELAKMKPLTKLQQEAEENFGKIISNIKRANKSIEEFNVIRTELGVSTESYRLLNEPEPMGTQGFSDYLPKLTVERQYLASVLVGIEKLKKMSDEYNRTLAEMRTNQGKVSGELIKNQRAKNDLDGIMAKRRMMTEEETQLKTEIEAFDKQNKDKIKEVDSEKTVVDRNLDFQKSHLIMIKKLKDYRNALPGKMAANLSDKTLEFYNIINDHDPDFEKLKELSIPARSGEKIQVMFRGNEQNLDALQILSDGHIKVLGLALLLAKVVAEDLRFVIFDDIVNAIDDDHRDGIARLLLEHPDLKKRQQIVTCHGEIFINKLAHKLGASVVSSMVKDYRFTPVDCVNERGVKMSVGNSTHYLSLASIHYNENKLKEALSDCRRATESISEQLWKKLGKNLGVNLTVKIRQPGNKPDLSSVVDGLNQELKKIGDVTLKDKFKTLKENSNWALLNKGIHAEEEQPEFERTDVKNLIDLLKQIEKEVIELKLQVSSVLEVET